MCSTYLFIRVIKYLGFSISAKNCSFSPTIDNLSIRAYRSVFAINDRFYFYFPTLLTAKCRLQGEKVVIFLAGEKGTFFPLANIKNIAKQCLDFTIIMLLG